jgi:hypothetical protein
MNPPPLIGPCVVNWHRAVRFNPYLWPNGAAMTDEVGRAMFAKVTARTLCAAQHQLIHTHTHTSVCSALLERWRLPIGGRYSLATELRGLGNT